MHSPPLPDAPLTSGGQASLDMYGKILEAIEVNDYDNFRKRAYISKTEKLLTLPSSYLKSLNPGKIDKVNRILVLYCTFICRESALCAPALFLFFFFFVSRPVSRVFSYFTLDHFLF